MKAIKRIVLVLGIIVVLAIGALAAIPFFFKDRLVEETKAMINESINASVDFSDVSLSVFRHFPQLTLGLEDFSIVGKDRFEGLRLASAEELAISVDLYAVLSGNTLTVKNIDLDQPDVHILVLKDGTANYNIAKASDTEESASSNTDSEGFVMALQNYAIKDGQFVYDDASLNTFVEASGINHEGSGAFTTTVYDLDTDTEVESLSVDYGGIAYLKKATAKIEAIFNIDQNSKTYTLKDNDIIVNALRLIGDGAIQLAGNEDIQLDLAVRAPQNEFKNLLSMIPGAYLEGYEEVKANGQFALNGTVKGIYNGAKNLMPALDFDLEVSNADLQYPDLPLGIDNINAQASLISPISNLDQMKINIPTFNLSIGNNPIQGRFALATPLSDPNIDTELEGKLILEELAQAFPMEGIKTLKGTIDADLKAQARMSQIDQGNYQQVDMSGVLAASGLEYESEAYPVVKVDHIQASFSPESVEIPAFEGQLGKSDLKGSAKIENVLAYFSPEATMKGEVRLTSDYFLVDEWLPSSSEEAEPTAGQIDTLQAPSDDLFDRYDFKVDAQIKQIDYADYQLQNTVAIGRFSPERFALSQASTQIEDSDVFAYGEIFNVLDYVFEGEELYGNLEVTSDRLNLNPFMTMIETAPEDSVLTAPASPTIKEYGVLLVPDNLNLELVAKVKELIYTNMEINNFSGNLKVAEETVELRDIGANTLGGRLRFEGLYSTEDKTAPSYGMRLNLDRLDFRKSFETMNTFKALAPIGKFIEGVYNTALSVEGTLTNGMMPDLNTLNVAGFFETLDGNIKNLPFLEEIGDKLRILELKKSITIENSKNWLEIKNGMVEIKPFDWNIEDIEMTIAGKHGILGPMDYNIDAHIPRAKLENNAIGAALGTGLNTIQQEAAKLGVNWNQAETVEVIIHLTGQLNNPKLGFKFMGADGKRSVEEVVTNTAKDIIKEKLGDKADSTLAQESGKLEEKGNAIIDSAKAEVNKKVEDITKKTTSKVDSILKGKVDTVLTKEANKVLDTLLKKTEVEKVKKELEKFNPFKKKKKKNEG